MKPILFCPLPALGCLALASCGVVGNINEPISGGHNPLDSPGSGSRQSSSVEATGSKYSAGQWLETTVPSAALYSRVPRRNDQPYRTLALGTPLKVIATEGTYVKVELESGDIGFVPTIMVAEKSVAQDVPIVPDMPEGVAAPPPPLTEDAPYTGVAPEPEVPPLSVEEAAAPTPDVINPGDKVIELRFQG